MRDNIEDDYNLKELQNVILNIMGYIDFFCHKYNINYCLMGGSMLGAKRHKGFIPWDDDLDIFMTPSNYEKFRDLFQTYGDKERFYLQEWGASEGMITIAKVRLNHSSYIELDLKKWKIHQGIFVDIFILHSCPNNRVKRYIQYAWAKYIILKGLCNRSYSRKKGGVALVLKIMRLFPKRFLLKTGLKQVYKYRAQESDFYCNYLGKARLKNGTYKKKYFESSVKAPFETIHLHVPIGIESFLTDRFGDYMKVPSKERIKYEQHAEAWSLNDFPTYSPINNYPDEKYLI